MNDWKWEPPGDQFEKKVREIGKQFSGKGPGRKMFVIIGLIFLLFIVGNTSFYTVDTEQTGVVLRFGKFIGFAEPGLRFKIPMGIDRVYLVKTGRVLKEEFGFRTVSPGVRSTYNKRGLEEESLTLTGDLNVSDVEWIVQYQIANPFKYLFKIKQPEHTIRDIAEAVVRRVIGNSNVTEVLTTERAELAEVIETDLQKTLNNYDIGVRIVTVKFQDVNPPEQVKAAFNEVNESEQQKESLIFQAREQYNREVPKAKGVAKNTILNAEGYALERINNAKGEAERFAALLREYRKAPEVTRRRLYLETMEEILPQVGEVYLIDKNGAGALPLLPLRGNVKGGKS
jgi:membrane protease subunit HflK